MQPVRAPVVLQNGIYERENKKIALLKCSPIHFAGGCFDIYPRSRGSAPPLWRPRLGLGMNAKSLKFLRDSPVEPCLQNILLAVGQEGGETPSCRRVFFLF